MNYTYQLILPDPLLGTMGLTGSMGIVGPIGMNLGQFRSYKIKKILNKLWKKIIQITI